LTKAAENADTNSVEGAKIKFAALQAEMEANLKAVEDKREE
jgi:hypothetical protein